MTLQTLRPELRWAIEAAQDKKAQHVTVLDLEGLGAFSEYFLLCSGESTPQLEAITDAIEERLAQHGRRPEHREGRPGAEWVLLDYGRFVVHVFSERARLYYDLERLWRAGPRIDIPSPDDPRAAHNRSNSNSSSSGSPESESTQP
ncbi:MAG: ribosome silencing factor [Candidatus Acidiferrales bacterium]